MDKNQNMFIVDTGNKAIRKIVNGGTSVSTFSSGPYVAPVGAVWDVAGMHMYVTDRDYIWQLDSDGRFTSHLFGNADGTGTSFQFGTLRYIDRDDFDNMYVADTNGYVRQLYKASAGLEMGLVT